jgi:LCP family protein required for cell wall assembly
MKPIQQLVENAGKKLKGEERDRINILLLGMGGKNHAGGYLTDTIMLLSLQPSSGKVGMVSIPRDLVVPIEGLGWKKINHINAYAENNNKDSGGLATSQAIGAIFNVPIDYYVRADFEGFIKIIDHLGGIEVDVENTLDDYSYPVMGMEDGPWNSRWEHLHVDKGLQTMDGELALKFARSRHGVGGEGSDFARARRQQLILQAAKDKALSFNMLFKPMTIKNILTDLNEHVSTNIEVSEAIRFWDLAKDIKKENMINKVLDTSPDGLLSNSVGEDGAYILQPKNNDFSDIQQLIENIFSNEPEQKKIEVASEQTKVDLRNGTWKSGLANSASADLEKYGFKVVNVGNTTERNYKYSIIYDLTYGTKLKSLKILKENTNAQISFGAPDWLSAEIKQGSSEQASADEPDFIMILGEDLAEGF